MNLTRALSQFSLATVIYLLFFLPLEAKEREIEICKSAPYKLTLYSNDGGVYKIRTNEIDRWFHSEFEEFVKNIIDYLAVELANNRLCSEGSQIDLEFYSNFLIRENRFERAELNGGTCQIKSPWVDIKVTKKPNLNLHLIVDKDHRQFAVGQALLLSKKHPSLRQPKFLNNDKLRHYAKTFDESKDKSESIQSTTFYKEGFIPFELKWLYENSRGYIESNDMNPSGDIIPVIVELEKGYILIVKSLIKHCLDERATRIQLRDINDFLTLFPDWDMNKYYYRKQ